MKHFAAALVKFLLMASWAAQDMLNDGHYTSRYPDLLLIFGATDVKN
jgi:hypothetical protein